MAPRSDAPAARLPARASAVGLTVASGVLYGLAFPTASLRTLAWVALVPFFVALRRVRLTSAAMLAWLWTVTAAYTLGDWFAGSIARYYEQPLLVGVAFFLGVSSLLAAPYYVLFATAYRTTARLTSPAAPLVTAAAWVAAELARARIGGNPWALFGYSQMGRDALMQVADVTGVYGVSFALAAVNAALASVVAGGRAGLRQLPTAAAVVAAILGYGYLRPATLAAPSAAPVDVAVVQGNLDLGTQWREEFYGRNLDTYLQLTERAVAGRRPALVVWPENALSFFVESEPSYRRAIGRILAPSGAQLLAGGPRTGADTATFFNSMFLLAPDGQIAARYDKQRLVPFGEYFPLAFLEGAQRRFGRLRNFTPGASDFPIATAAGLAGITICSEAMFPELAAARVRHGAEFFVDPAHDTWLTPKFSAQQFDIVRLRAVEQRRYIVRASTSGPSAIVDPAGRVVARTDFFTQTTLAGRIEPRRDLTVYARVGDLFAGLCAAATIAAVGVARARRARA